MAGVTRHREKTRRGRVVLIVVIAALVAWQAWSTIRAQWAETDAQDQTMVVEQQRDATAAQAASLAEQIKMECGAGDLTGPICQHAEQVAAEPIPGPVGPAGRGVSGLAVNAGHLIVTYTDGGTEDVGPVIGADGADGAPGRGIADVGIAAGRLVVAFSDGGTQDLGPVVGADGRDGLDGRAGQDGRGIASIDQVAGRLVITYTDGATEDAGPLPAGSAGAQGAQGVGVQNVRFDDTRCELVFELFDPATGAVSPVAVPLPPRVCDSGAVTVP